MRRPAVSFGDTFRRICFQKALIPGLDILENGLLSHILVSGNGSEETIQSTDSQGRMCWNCDPVGRGMLGLKDNMTAHLMDFHVFPTLAEVPDQFFSAQIAWEFHATASTSSRIRCRRMEAVAIESI